MHITFFIQTQETCLMSCLRCNIFTLKQIKPLSTTRSRRVCFVCVCVFTLLPSPHCCVYFSYYRLLFQALHQPKDWCRPARVTHSLWAENMGMCLPFCTIRFRELAGILGWTLGLFIQNVTGIWEAELSSKLSSSRLFLGGWARYVDFPEKGVAAF